MSRHALSHAPRRLGFLVVLLGVLALPSATVLASQAGATTVQQATLSVTTDEHDNTGQGRTFAYDTNAGDAFRSHDWIPYHVQADVQAANGDWWYLRFAAPEGQTLAAGTYEPAERYFADPSKPGLDVFGSGSSCISLGGSFTVNEVTFGVGGQVESVDIEFEQRCEYNDGTLHGHLRLIAEPAPPPLDLGLGLASSGSVDRGSATVGGTVTCNRPASVYVSGTLTQRGTQPGQATAYFGHQVECTGSTPWQATVSSETSVPFVRGTARLDANAFAFDPAGGDPAREAQSAAVKLTR